MRRRAQLIAVLLVLAVPAGAQAFAPQLSVQADGTFAGDVTYLR